MAAEVQRLYGFAYLMLCTRSGARRLVDDVVIGLAKDPETITAVLAGPSPARELLGVVARHIDALLPRKAQRSFEGLDFELRSSLTRPARITGPDQVHTLLWELKRTCLTAALNCLPPAVRMAFILTDLMDIDEAEAARLLQIKESAYRVRLARGRKRLEDYLAPRCQHMDPKNPCKCDGRLAIAIDRRFVKLPPHSHDIPAQAHDADGPHRNILPLYRGLPTVRLSEGRVRELLDRLGPSA
ncbi:MAG: RNA polymerase sigma factor [Myxococcales bacterium]|nr:RNA polymerase sigma factor [Myxococcales bacterium]